jgi:hypothetical protein
MSTEPNRIPSFKTPMILGAQYSPISQDWPDMILESADLKSDFIRLKDPESPFVFESNYATFSLYWKMETPPHTVPPPETA